ncbi:MAG TPA: outer membrane beta-barrel protein [Vicinamibacterales bacterium]|nr:outer membrane beta-barrel protein [Vicinamibacterales bacterium]
MKVRIGSLAALALFLFTPDVFAQAPAGGAFIGFNQSYYATQPKNETNAKQGLVAGVFGVLRREKTLKIQPELQFSQRRVEVNYAGSLQTHTNSYVNLGLLLRTNLFKGLYSTQGPQFMLPVSGKLDVNGTELDLKDNINSDFSLVVGLGRQFGRIGVEARWDSGFKRIEDAPIGNFVKRNRAITVIGIVAF